MVDFHSESIDNLFSAILTLKTVGECYAFFEDACTIKELTEIAQRLEVAKLLDQGESYTVISSKTGASTATISRVNKCLTYGADGYKLVMDRIKGGESNEG